MKHIKPPHFRLFRPLLLCLLVAATLPLPAATDVTIGTSATTGGTFSKGGWSPTSSPCRIHVNDLIAALNVGSVTINTTGKSLENGDVVIAATLPLDNLVSPVGQRLTLNAQRSILINAAIAQNVKGGDDDPDAMSLLLNADLAGGATGVVAVSANVDTGGGNISVSGAGMTMAALTTISTRGGSLAATLAGALTLSGSAINTSGGPFTVSAGGSGTISPNVTTSGENILVTASGILTVSGRLDATGGAGVGSVEVFSSANTLTVTSAGQLRAGPAGTTTARANGKVTLAGVLAGGTARSEAEGGVSDLEIQNTGSVSASSGQAIVRAGNHLTLAGPVSASGPITITADSNLGGVGNVTSNAGGTITAQNSPVSITGRGIDLIDAIQTNGGDLSMTATGDITFGAGAIATGGGAFSLNAATFSAFGPVTTSGAAVSITSSGSGTISNDFTTSGGDMTVTLTGAGAVLGVTAGSDINSSGGAGTARTRLLASNGSMNLASAITSGTGGVEITASTSTTLPASINGGGGNVTLTLTGPAALLTLQAPVSTSGNGSITARSNAGGVFVKPTANLTARTVLLETAGGTDDLNFQGVITGGAGGVTLRSADDVLLNSALNASGPITIAADTNLSGAGSAISNAGGTITAQNSPVAITGRAIDLIEAIHTNGGSLSMTATGDVTFGTGVVATGGGAFSLNAATFSAFGPVITSGAAVSITTSGSGSIANDFTTSGGDVTVTLTGAGAVLNVTAGSDINSSGGAGTARTRLLASNGSMNLASAITSGTGGVEITASTSTTLPASINGGGGNVTLTLTGPAALLTLQAPVSTSGNGSITARSNAGGTLVKPTANLTARTVLLETAGGTDDLNFQGAITGGAGGVTLRSADDVLLNSALNASGPITIAADTNLSGAGSAISNAGGTITAQNSPVAITGRAIDLIAAIHTNGGSLSLTAVADVAFGTGVIATGGGAFSLNAATFSAFGPVTTSGAAVSITSSGSGSISNDFTTSGGDVTVTLTGAGAVLGVTAGSDINSSGGAGTARTRLLASNGSMNLASAITSGTGGVEITASTSTTLPASINGGGGNVTLTLTGPAALLTLQAPVSTSGNGGITARSNAGGVTAAASASLSSATGGSVILYGHTGVILDGDIPAAGNVDVDCVTGNIAIGATSSITNSGGLIAFDAGNSTVTTAAGAIIAPGPASKLHLQARTGFNDLIISIPLTSGTGGLELLSDDDVFISAALNAGGPITIQSDVNNGGLGMVQATASIQTSSHAIEIAGQGVSLAGVGNSASKLHILNTGEAMNFGGNISPGGGLLFIESTASPVFSPGLTFDLGLGGSLEMIIQNKPLLIPADLAIVNARSIALQATGGTSDLTVLRPLGIGTGGATFAAANRVVLGAGLNCSGPLLLQADADLDGVGDLAVGGSINGSVVPVTLRGSTIGLNAPVDTTSGEIRIQPNPGTTASVNANLNGPTRLVSGTTRFGTGTIAGESLTVDDAALLAFDSPGRVLAPAGFLQHNSLAETRIRIGGTGVGQFNRIAASGQFTAGGRLSVSFEKTYAPAAGHHFKIFDFTAFSGAFASFSLPALSQNQVWDTSQLAVNGTLRIVTPVELWRQQYFQSIADAGDAASQADPDADSIPNLVEYALGLDPTKPSPGGLPVLGTTTIGGFKYLTLTLTRPPGIPDVSYRFQVGGSIPPGDDGSFYSAAADIPSNGFTTEVSRGFAGQSEIITVRDNLPLTGATRRFMRLKVLNP